MAFGIGLPLLGGACSKSSDTAATVDQSTTTTTAAASAINAGPTIEISELKFTPSAASAKVGQVITWKNTGASKHQVQEEPTTAGAKPIFESELMKPDSTYVFTPTAPGTFNYICRIHPQDMRGTITVTQ